MIKLGNKVRCIITGFEGIATAKVEFINGCIQYGVRARAKDNTIPDTVYLDVEQLEVVDEGISMTPKETGGDRTDTPRGVGLSR